MTYNVIHSFTLLTPSNTVLIFRFVWMRSALVRRVQPGDPDVWMLREAVDAIGGHHARHLRSMDDVSQHQTYLVQDELK